MEAVEVCENCRKMFPESKIDSHFSYCRRNIRRCELCSEMVDINHLDEHMEEAHSKEECQWCKMEVDSKHTESHKKACPNRPIVCAYCEQSVPSKTFDDHQWECGARTKRCLTCSKDILMRDFDMHEATCREPPTLPPPATVRAYADYNDYLRKNRERLQLEQKEELKPMVIERVRVSAANQASRKPGESSGVKHEIKELGSRVVHISQPKPLNKEDLGYSYEPRSATVIRTTVTTSYRPVQTVASKVTVSQQQPMQHYAGFQDEDAELQRALLESMSLL